MDPLATVHQTLATQLLIFKTNNPTSYPLITFSGDLEGCTVHLHDVVNCSDSLFGESYFAHFLIV